MAHELGDHGFAEAFDVHDAAGGVVEELFGEACGAACVDAAEVDFAFRADDGFTAARAAGGKDDVACAAWVLRVVDNLCDFGDDVAAALDGDEIADADAEAGDLVGIVERGAGDGDAADGHGGECGDGGELAGAAHLEEDIEQLGDGTAGGEFVGDGPAGRFAGEAEAALLGSRVDLDDDAVDFVAEGVAVGFGFRDEGEDVVNGGDSAGAGIGAEAGDLEGFEGCGLLG